MGHLMRNVSLGLNVVLLAALGLAGAWDWELGRRQARVAHDLSESTHDIDAYKSYVNATGYANSLVGARFPVVELTSVDGRPVSTDFSTCGGGLVLLFKPQACQPCLITQLKCLRHLDQAQRELKRLRVIAISALSREDTRSFTKVFDLGYPLVAGGPEAVFGAGLAEKTPIVFLVDPANRIIASHWPSPGRPEISVLFFHELTGPISQHLGIALEPGRAGLGLAGQSMADVVRNKYDSAGADDVLY